MSLPGGHTLWFLICLAQTRERGSSMADIMYIAARMWLYPGICWNSVNFFSNTFLLCIFLSNWCQPSSLCWEQTQCKYVVRSVLFWNYFAIFDIMICCRWTPGTLLLFYYYYFFTINAQDRLIPIYVQEQVVESSLQLFLNVIYFLDRGCELRQDVVVGSGTQIGSGSVVSGCVVGRNCTIGQSLLVRSFVKKVVYHVS